MEVKSLSERINAITQENATNVEILKTEFEIKIVELEQQLEGTSSSAAKSATDI